MTTQPVEPMWWSKDPAVLEDARSQAFEYNPALQESAQERAWSARLDAALEGMAVLAPDTVTAWIEHHAESAVPHLDEADLVAGWETHVRDDVRQREDDAWLAEYDVEKLADQYEREVNDWSIWTENAGPKHDAAGAGA